MIALFIFAIVSSLIAVALRTVINAQSETEVQSARFRNLEMAWIIFANDIQQTTNRPILDASGRQEAAFIGLQASMTFTHMGWPNPRGELLRSTLQRTRYRLQDHTVLREIWPELDRGQAAIPLARPLLHDVAMLRFEYLDERGQSYAMWPVSKQPNLSPLPRAVRIIVVWVDGQKMSQLYVIPH
ncbi:MAG: type II secretion system protein GspJ [Gammaproteobacteria bacterium RIFCSPHIGHO2_12_FULL_41_20]|nr:MAG: type II secretion system protein GspJ [Gammaproteobacteria bacterium RIFCSPHIGHO2_12_FULL_41_20]